MSIGAVSSSFSYPNINSQNQSKPDTNKMLASSDVDGSGGLDKSEFAALGASMNKGSAGDAFSQFDLNGDGEVTAEEMRQALESTQKNVTSNNEDNTSSMLNELMSQNFQAIMGIMNSSSNSSNTDDKNNFELQSPVVNRQFSNQIQEYMKQATQGATINQSISSLI